jgi:hypothetical protein
LLGQDAAAVRVNDESLRIGLNRAYDEIEMRPWWVLRLESIAYVLVGAAGLIALAFLIVLAPLIFHTALPYAPWLATVEAAFTFARFGVATVVLVVALVLVQTYTSACPLASRTTWPDHPGANVTHRPHIRNRSWSFPDIASSQNFSICSSGMPTRRMALVTWPMIRKSSRLNSS